MNINELAEAAARASELMEATNNLEIGNPGEQSAAWHSAANSLVESLQFELGKRAGLVTDDGWKNRLGESLYAGVASRADCMRAAAQAARNGESI